MAQATNIVVVRNSDGTVTFTWTPGSTSALERSYVWVTFGLGGHVANPSTGTDYAASSVYGSGDSPDGDNSFCVAKIANNLTQTVTVSGLDPATDYTASITNAIIVGLVYDTSDATGNPQPFTTLAAEPTVQASGISISNVTATSFLLDVADPIGDGDGSFVWIKAASSGFPGPVDGTDYPSSDADNYTLASQIGSSGWFRIGSDGTLPIIVNGLSANTAYRVAVTCFKGDPGGSPPTVNYLTSTATNNPKNQTTTASTPATQASNLEMVANRVNGSFAIGTRGDGPKVAVFIKAGNSTGFAPVDGDSYTANLGYGVGSQIGSSGWFCIYNGTGTGTLGFVTGLTPGVQYYIRAAEYNDSGNFYNATTATANPANGTTASTTIPGSYFFDDFNRANSDDIGNGWIQEGTVGHSQIASNKLKFHGTSPDTAYQQIYQDIALVGQYKKMKFTINMAIDQNNQVDFIAGILFDVSSSPYTLVGLRLKQSSVEIGYFDTSWHSIASGVGITKSANHDVEVWFVRDKIIAYIDNQFFLVAKLVGPLIDTLNATAFGFSSHYASVPGVAGSVTVEDLLCTNVCNRRSFRMRQH